MAKQRSGPAPDDQPHDPAIYGEVRGPYTQRSVRARIEALFLDNVGKVLSREQIQQAARDPKSGMEPENWHQRLSELRTDSGYTILSWRNRGDLKVEEYLMPHIDRRPSAARRVRPTRGAWERVLVRAGSRCEWEEGGGACGLSNGDIDPVGGGTVRLTPDHRRPHAINPAADPDDPEQWQALCGRHQVVKKNYWDSLSGKLNVYAIVQAALRADKQAVFRFLLDHFGYDLREDGNVVKKEAAS